MVQHARRLRRHWRLLVTAALATVAAAAVAGTPPANSARTTASSRAAAAKKQLAGVRAEIARIAAAQRATAAQRNAANAALAKNAARLDQAANAVRRSDAAIAAKTATLTSLQQRQTGVEARLATQRRALAQLLRASYILDRKPGLWMLLGAGSIDASRRALIYARYFQRDRATHIKALQARTAELDALEASITTATQALQQQHDQRTARVARLQQARVAQQKLLSAADATLSRQKGKLAALQRNAKALDKLLQQLQNVFADIPAEIGQNTPFAKLRGKLAWPVAGNVKHGASALQPGIVIAAAPGTAVHAVAHGRVAWASFMRGYGILVIIDHGDGWMSLYGGNESASVTTGEWVKPGQTIASVGRDPEVGGAWFGLRHNGQPVDPGGWFAARH